jgi:hypothetical protein
MGNEKCAMFFPFKEVPVPGLCRHVIVRMVQAEYSPVYDTSSIKLHLRQHTTTSSFNSATLHTQGQIVIILVLL